MGQKHRSTILRLSQEAPVSLGRGECHDIYIITTTGQNTYNFTRNLAQDFLPAWRQQHRPVKRRVCSFA